MAKTSKARKTKVWVLTITNRLDRIITVHRTLRGGRDALYAYVKDNWDIEVDFDPDIPRPMPTDADEAIEEYFDRMQDRGEQEHYVMTIEDLQP